MTELVRICPVCDAHNAPQRARCACGASLLGIDFSLPGAAVPAAPRPDADGVDATNGAATDDGAGRVMPSERSITGSTDASRPPDADAGSTAASARAVANSGAPGDVTAEPLATLLGEPLGTLPRDGRTTAASVPRVCPYADCAQTNPAGAIRCLYCNRPLAGDVPPAPAPLDTRPLPAALRDRYTIRDVFPATGSEADILLVDDVSGGPPAVVKLYRKGLRPDFDLLAILAASVGDAVVHVLAHGVSDGVAYEVLEYLPGGTLQAYLEAGPVPASEVRAIVAQIADALRGIHAHRIIHRDVKPENVLLRSRHPLTLALTDFGIASISAATQHFTSAARTTQYAAPEVLTGVIDRKSDWWSLGMIALEAATGRHPFAGLTEQVMNHQLATRPIDVRGVVDDDLRRLCRGLLLRDPQRRWGDAEVRRWLAGDPSLEAPEDRESATAVKPYRIAGVDCTSAEELGIAMARHWDDARKDLARGQVARWVETELHDYDLLRRIRDVQEVHGGDDDVRLLRVLRRLCPGLPPLWRGTPLDRATLVAIARRATDDDGDAQRWLASLLRERVLEELDGDAGLAALGSQWREGWSAFVARWREGAARHAASRAAAARTGHDGGGPASFDEVVFGTPVQHDPPDEHLVAGPLLLAQNEPSFVAALRDEVTQAMARLPAPAPWFESLVDTAGDDAIAWLAARALLDLARADADADAQRDAAARRARDDAVGAARTALRALVESLLVLAPEDADIDAARAALLTERFDALQEQCTALQGLDLSDTSHEALRTIVDKLQVQGFAVQRALGELERDRSVDQIFMTRERISFAAIALVVALLTRMPWVIVGTVVALGGFLLYRWHTRFQSTDRVLAALRRFRLPARLFLREPA